MDWTGSKGRLLGREEKAWYITPKKKTSQVIFTHELSPLILQNPNVTSAYNHPWQDQWWHVRGELDAELCEVLAGRRQVVPEDGQVLLEVSNDGRHVATLVTHHLHRLPRQLQQQQQSDSKYIIQVQFLITQLIISIHINVSTTIGGLLQELNVQWSLLARWRGEQTVPHVT